MLFVTVNSLRIMFFAILISSFLSLGLIILTDFLPKKLKIFLEIIVTLPIFVPPSVSGYFILSVFGIQGIAGKSLYQWFGIRITFTVYGAILAGVIVSLPIVYQSIKLAIYSIEKEYIEEALLLGVKKFQLFRYVIFPMAKNGILAGVVLGAGRILGEFGATLMVAGNIPNKTQTLPVAIYSAVESGEDKKAMILVLIVLWISMIIMYLYNILRRRGVENNVNI